MSRALFLCALLALAGCAGGTAPVPLELELVRAGQASVAGRAAGRAPKPSVSRATLDRLGEPVLEVTLERRDQLAYLTVDAVRRDAGPGRVTVWRTQDNITVALRSGMLIATRGLGGDILSSEVQVSGVRPGPASGGAQVHMIRSLDTRAVRLSLACELEDLGPVQLEVVGRRHATNHVRQRCDATGGGQVVNEFWIEPAAGLVRQSRQWAGPHIGYLRIRRLAD